MNNAVVALLRSRPLRKAPLPSVLPLLELDLPADLASLLDAWARHGQPSSNSLASMDIFEAWDFQLAIEPLDEPRLRKMCATLAGSLARTHYPQPPFVQLGFDAGGHTVFAGVADGRTVTFSPEEGENYGNLDGLWFDVQQRADFVDEPALAPFLEAT